MGHLICIKSCSNAMNKPFNVGSIYKYYDDQFIDMMGVKYYYIYELYRVKCDNGTTKYRSSENKFGTGRKEFLDNYFVTVAEWSRLTKEVDLEFEKYFYD